MAQFRSKAVDLRTVSSSRPLAAQTDDRNWPARAYAENAVLQAPAPNPWGIPGSSHDVLWLRGDLPIANRMVGDGGNAATDIQQQRLPPVVVTVE